MYDRYLIYKFFPEHYDCMFLDKQLNWFGLLALEYAQYCCESPVFLFQEKDEKLHFSAGLSWGRDDEDELRKNFPEKARDPIFSIGYNFDGRLAKIVAQLRKQKRLLENSDSIPTKFLPLFDLGKHIAISMEASKVSLQNAAINFMRELGPKGLDINPSPIILCYDNKEIRKL